MLSIGHTSFRLIKGGIVSASHQRIDLLHYIPGMPVAFVHVHKCMTVQVIRNTSITNVQRLAMLRLASHYFLANATYH